MFRATLLTLTLLMFSAIAHAQDSAITLINRVAYTTSSASLLSNMYIQQVDCTTPKRIVLTVSGPGMLNGTPYGWVDGQPNFFLYESAATRGKTGVAHSYEGLCSGGTGGFWVTTYITLGPTYSVSLEEYGAAMTAKH